MDNHGLLICSECKPLFENYTTQNGFEVWGDGQLVRIINNPCSWGSHNPEVVILGFSKGDTQNRELERVRSGDAAFEDVPFKRMRDRLGWLLEALELHNGENLDTIFSASEVKFQCGSMIRCSISVRKDNGRYSFKMKDALDANAVSNSKISEIMTRCARKHLEQPKRGTVFLMLGLDNEYTALCKEIFSELNVNVRTTSDITYSNSDLLWLHVAHPSGSQPDPQYLKWVNGNTQSNKVSIVKRELRYWRDSVWGCTAST